MIAVENPVLALMGVAVIVLVTMIVMMVMSVVVIMPMPVPMVMMVVIVFGFEELRLDVENAVEVERLAVEHFGDRNLRTRGPVQLGVGIDGPDAAFDFA